MRQSVHVMMEVFEAARARAIDEFVSDGFVRDSLMLTRFEIAEYTGGDPDSRDFVFWVSDCNPETGKYRRCHVTAVVTFGFKISTVAFMRDVGP